MPMELCEKCGSEWSAGVWHTEKACLQKQLDVSVLQIKELEINGVRNVELLAEVNTLTIDLDKANRLYSELKEKAGHAVQWLHGVASLSHRSPEIRQLADELSDLVKGKAEVKRKDEMAEAIKAEVCCPKCKAACCVERNDLGGYLCDYCNLVFKP